MRYQTQGDHKFYFGSSATNSNLLFTLHFNGNATLAGTLTQSSDARLKKNINPITNSLSTILALNGYYYQWNDSFKDTALQSGILAQEVEKVLPHLVKKDENGTMSVNYSGLIPELIEAVKELKKDMDLKTLEIENLKKENELLRSDFQKRIEAIESKIK